MPVCEGRPNESCPKAAKGRGVVSCQGDLWLCRECEEFRFPSVKSANSGVSRPTAGRKLTRSSSSHSEATCQKSSTNSIQQPRNTHSSSSSSKGKESGMCISCLQLFLNDDKHVECSICAQKLHLNCSGVPQEAQDFLHSYASTIGYVCSDCRISMQQSFHQLQVAISVLTDELAVLKSEITQVKSSSSSCSVWQSSKTFGAIKPDTSAASAVPNAESIVPKSTNDNTTATCDEIVSLVERTVRDTTRRKRNVIISGLPERTDIDDRTAFLNICSEHLSVKPYLNTDSCVRIGKANSNQPRRLLVHLSSEDMASELLASAKKTQKL